MKISEKISKFISGITSADSRIVLALAALFSAFCCCVIYRYSIVPGGLPLWDESEHILNGLRIAFDARHFSLAGIWRDSYSQFAWGFLHSWIVGFFLFFFGQSVKVARVSSLFSFFLFPLFLYAIAARMNRTGRRFAGILAALFACASVELFSDASRAMIEMPVLLLSTIALYYLARALESGSVPDYALAGLFIALCFGAKYNFGVYYAASFFLFAISEAVFLKAGERIPAAKKHLFVFLPVAVILFFWLVYPHWRVGYFLEVISNTRVMGPSAFTMDGLLYYPGALAEYMGKPISLAVLGAFIVSFREFKSNRQIRFLLITAVLMLLLNTLHQQKCYRYIFMIYPQAILLAAYQVSKIRFNNALKLSFALMFACYVFFRVNGYAVSARDSINPEERAARCAVVSGIIDSLKVPDSVLIMGEMNEFSPRLFELELSRKYHEYIHIKELPKPRLDGIGIPVPEVSRAVNKGEFLKVLDEYRAKYIICIILRKLAPFYGEDYLLWNSWRLKYIPLLENDRDYRLVSTSSYDKLMMEVKIFRNDKIVP